MRRARRVGAALLLGAGCVTVLLASLAVWLNRTVVSTEGWVDTVGPLSREEAVATALADELTVAIADAANLDEYAAENLPEQAQSLVAPLGMTIREFVSDRISDFIAGDQFNTLWVEANERAHARFVEILEEQPPAAERAEEIELDLRSAVEDIDAQLEERGLDLFEGDVPEDVGDFQLFGEEQVDNARTAWDVLDALDWVLVLIAVVLLAGAVALSPRRRRTGIHVGVGLMITMAVFGVVVRFTRTLLFDEIETDTVRDAADAIWDDVREGLLQQTIALFVLGFLVAVGLWITGPAPLAVRLRAFADRQLASLRSGRLDHGRAGGLGSFLRRRRRAVEGGALALAILALLLLPRVSWGALVVAAAALLVFAGAVELLAGPASRAPLETT